MLHQKIVANDADAEEEDDYVIQELPILRCFQVNEYNEKRSPTWYAAIMICVWNATQVKIKGLIPKKG